MRKEVLFAIIIGFGLGLVITFGIWTANKALKQTAPKNQQEGIEKNEAISPTPTQGLPLFINFPENNSISNKEKVPVTGKTTPGAVVVVLFQEGETILEADNEGNFSTEISLSGGSNEIKVSSFDKEGNETSQTLSVIYSTVVI